MDRKKIMKSFWTLAFCLACLWGILAGRGVQASEPEKAKISYEDALRRYVKNYGKRLYGMSGFGKSGHCYYTYVGKRREIKIIGFEETARKIRIPDKIRGKKVKRIEVEAPEVIKIFYDGVVIIKPSKTRCIVIGRYVSSKDGAFQGDGSLSHLERIEVSPRNKAFMAKDGVLFSRDGRTLWEYPDQRRASRYKIPEGVTKVANCAFEHAKVRKVTMPDTVKTLGSSCFSDLKNLREIRLSKKLIKMGEYSFFNTPLKKISLPGGLESIGFSAFSRTDIRKLSLPGSLKSLGMRAFAEMPIREVSIPGSVKKIPEECFSACKRLKKVMIRNGVKEIGGRAFEYCYHLEKLVIPSSVKKLRDPFSIAPFEGELEEGEEDPDERDVMEWRNAGVAIYAKKGCYAYREFNKKYWREKLGIKVKAM